MSGRQDKVFGRPWLSAVALLSFLPAFGAARLFTYFLPQVVIVQSGIHLHHFWYGLILLGAGGWLGIAGPERRARLAAVMYGLGGGLLADEVGLLVTLGDYQTGFTFTVVVGVFAATATGSLLLRYWREIIDDLRKIAPWERAVLLGLSILVLPFILGSLEIQTGIVGILAAVAYRAKFGTPWRISRSHLIAKLAGFVVLAIVVAGVGLAVRLFGEGFFVTGPPEVLVLLIVLLGLLALNVASGLVGGWAWVRLARRD